MFCTKCGQEIITDVKFCIKCGNPFIIENTLNNVSTVNSEPIQVRFCTSCGTQINKNTKFCTKCGTSAEKPQNVNNQVVFKQISNTSFLSKISKKQKVLLIAGVALIIFLIIGFIPFVDIMAFSNQGGKVAFGKPLFFSGKGKSGNYASGNHLYYTKSLSNENIILKNGQIKIIPYYGGVGRRNIKSIFINGNDVYFCGSIDDVFLNDEDRKYGSIPFYIKNSKMFILSIPVDSEYARASSMFVSGNDVYITGGYYFNGPGPPRMGRPLTCHGYWKNDVFIPYNPDIYNIPDSIFVSDNYLYTAEVRRDVNDEIKWVYHPCYTKNGQEVFLSDIKNNNFLIHPNLQSIYVDRNDVYVSGYYYFKDKYKYVLWKNNKIIRTYNTSYTWYSNFIVRRNLFSLLKFKE